MKLYLSQGGDDIRGEEGGGDIVNREHDGPAEDEGDPVDVVTDLWDELGEVLKRHPLLTVGHLLGGHRYADCVAVRSTVTLKCWADDLKSRSY